MVNLDNQAWINDIDYYGETITLRVVTDSSYSKWGDATESTADTTSIKAMVAEISEEQLKEAEGEFNNEDKIFIFKGDQASIVEGNRIIHDSITYELIRIMRRQTAGITFAIEAWGKKT